MPNVARRLAGLSIVVLLLATACVGDGRAGGEAREAAPVATPDIVLDAEPYEGPVQVVHLPAELRERPADVLRTLPPAPPSPFPAWDGSSVLIYDLETNEVLYDLGEGSLGAFSPDGRWFAWSDGERPFDRTDIFAIELATGARRSFPQGLLETFNEDGRLVITLYSPQGRTLFDIESGDQAGDEPAETPDFMNLTVQYPGGFRVQRRQPNLRAFDDVTWFVIPDDGSRALQIEASAVVPISERELLVLTRLVEGSLNMFLVDAFRGDVRFIASAFGTEEHPALLGGSDGIAWTDHRCDPVRGRTRIYDFETREITEFDRAVPPARIAGGVLEIGFALYARATIDLDSLEYTNVFPDLVRLSADGRFAAIGQTPFGGADGLLCGS